MKTISCLQLTLTVWLATWDPWCSAALRQGGPSPSSEFVAQPSNITVPAGEQAVLKCKIAQRAHVCRWYYLEFGLDFFDERVTPLLVKDFSPKNHKDCSIRIKPVRKVQEGQWLCQALKFHSSKFLMTRPANLRVITEEDTASWTPPDTEDLEPRGGRREDGIYEQPQPLEFETTDEDPVVNTPLGEPVTLKCQVNQPIAFCSWIMPNGAVFYKPLDEDENKSEGRQSDYKITGDLMEGNCSLALRETRPQDEGNWRCVVKATTSGNEVRGPLIHLHMTEHHLPGEDGTALVDPDDDSLNFLVISLVIICTLLSIIVVLLFTCLYRRGKIPSEETRKILQISPRSSMEFNHKTLPVTDLTASSVMAVEPNKMRHHSYVDLQDYHQYLDMSKGSTTDTGYTRMSGSSVRSSMSSRTTLSTLSTLPVGRCRSASNSTTLTDSSPNLTTVVDNPSYNADIVHVNRGIVLPRPASVYSNDHVYEEIKERKDELQLMDKIVESSPVTPETPTYTNTTEDFQGYMIPKKSPSTEPLNSTPTVTSKAKLPLPDIPALSSHLLPVRDSPAGADPPYSRIGETGLVPENTGMATTPLGPGYSRVGTVNQDPMSAYDIPRAIPTEVIESYDVPRRTDSEVSLQATTTMSPDNCGDALVGTIV